MNVKPVGMQRRIIGEVIRKMENCVVMSVVRYDGIDHDEIEERCGRVAAFGIMKSMDQL